MGLDVYLYQYEIDPEKLWEMEDEAEKVFNERLWENSNYENMTDEEKDAIIQTVMTEFKEWKIDKWGSSNLKTEICFPSKTYPNDICQIGYIRSSYNSAGMNSRLRRTVGHDLAWIFGVDDNIMYRFRPDWTKCLTRVNQMIEWVDQYIKTNGYIDIIPSKFNPFIPVENLPSDEAEALVIFSQQKIKNGDMNANTYIGGNYSCYYGDFYFTNPLTVKAIIPGTIYGDSCMYVIIEHQKTGDEPVGIEWALQSLHVVKETIEYALAMDEEKRNQLVIHWSA